MRILIALLLLVPGLVLADTVTLEWEPPTTREDGTALDPATEIEEYRVYCRYDDAESFSSDSVLDIPGLTETGEYETSRSDLLPDYGEYECAMTAVDTDGRESQHSNIVEVSWLAPPAAPGMPTSRIVFD